MAKKKDTGDIKSALILLALIALGIVGTFWSGMVVGRNYQSAVEGFLKRVGILFFLIPSAMLNALVFGLLLTDEDIGTYQHGPIYIYREDPVVKQQYEDEVADWEARKSAVKAAQQEWDRDLEEQKAREESLVGQVGKFAKMIGVKKAEDTSEPEPRPVFEEPVPVYVPAGVCGNPKPDGLFAIRDRKLLITQEAFLGLVASLVIFIMGIFVGLIQRGGRSRKFVIDAENREFLTSNNLSENSDGGFVDTQSGQVFRVEDTDDNKITLFPKGTRGKRAYIYMDGQGRFSEFSGIIKV